MAVRGRGQAAAHQPHHERRLRVRNKGRFRGAAGRGPHYNQLLGQKNRHLKNSPEKYLRKDNRLQGGVRPR
jgi:hypothetical protein